MTSRQRQLVFVTTLASVAIIVAVTSMWLLLRSAMKQNRVDGTVQTLVDKLADENQTVRKDARVELAKIGKPAVRALISALSHENQVARWEAAETLGMIGPEAREAVPALIQVFMNDQKNTPRRAAADGLAGIGYEAKAAIPVLLEHIDDPAVGFEATEAIKAIDPSVATSAAN
jgi:HEAT repeat protein